MPEGSRSVTRAGGWLSLVLLATVLMSGCHNPRPAPLPNANTAVAASTTDTASPPSSEETLASNDPLLNGLEVNEKFQPLVANKGPHRKYADREGKVSWYHEPQKMADGEKFDPEELVGAHTKFPLGTIVRATNLESGKSVIVIIKDRGPYIDGRDLDLSRAAARRLGMVKEGVIECRIEVLAYPRESAKG